MKIKSLLAAVSMVAITAGTASALSIPTVASTAAPGSNDVMKTASPDGVTLANELQLPTGRLGFLEFALQTETGTYPAGDNFIATITLPDGVETDGGINSNVLTGLFRDPGNASPNVRTDDMPDVGAGSATILSQNGSVLELNISIPQTGDSTSALIFSIPVKLTSCDVGDTLTANVVFADNRSIIEGGGAASISSPISGCASAFNTDFTPDNIGANVDSADTIIGLDDYLQLKDNASGGLVIMSEIGLYDALIDPTVFVDLNNTVLTDASIDEVTFDICFGNMVNGALVLNGDEIASVVIDGVPGIASADGSTYSFDTSFLGDITDMVIEVVVEGDDSIESRGVFVKNIVHDFTDAGGPDLIASELGTDASLDALQREGQEFGDFDWNSGPAGSQTISVYRITGLEPGVPVTYTATLYNSFADGPLPSQTVTGNAAGEAALFSTNLAGVPANVDRYDLRLNFETGRPLDVDRLLSKGDVVTAYGDGANLADVTLGRDPMQDDDNSRASR